MSARGAKRVNQLGRRPPSGSRFQEPEPDQWSENASLHGAGTKVPLRLQNAGHGRRAKPRECLSRQPIVCRCRKRPQDDTHLALGPRIERVSVEIGKVDVPECDMEQEGLQGSVLLGCEHSSTQRRRYQLSAIRSEKLRRLSQNANEMQRQEVWLVYDLLKPQQLSLVVIWRLDDPEHLLDHGAGQVAGRSQFQSTGLGCSSKQE